MEHIRWCKRCRKLMDSDYDLSVYKGNCTDCGGPLSFYSMEMLLRRSRVYEKLDILKRGRARKHITQEQYEEQVLTLVEEEVR